MQLPADGAPGSACRLQETMRRRLRNKSAIWVSPSGSSAENPEIETPSDHTAFDIGPLGVSKPTRTLRGGKTRFETSATSCSGLMKPKSTGPHGQYRRAHDRQTPGPLRQRRRCQRAIHDLSPMLCRGFWTLSTRKRTRCAPFEFCRVCEGFRSAPGDRQGV
jgi:hypothetical protein